MEKIIVVCPGPGVVAVETDKNFTRIVRKHLFGKIAIISSTMATSMKIGGEIYKKLNPHPASYRKEDCLRTAQGDIPNVLGVNVIQEIDRIIRSNTLILILNEETFILVPLLLRRMQKDKTFKMLNRESTINNYKMKSGEVMIIDMKKQSFIIE